MRFLKEQRDLYIERLKKAPAPPTRILVEIRSLKSVKREVLPDPTEAFMYWVRANITSDHFEQITAWNGKISGFMQQAMELTGAYTLASLDTDIVFNPRDSVMLRWLQERSYREAQLIQGATDEFVINALWNAMYQEYSIPAAVEYLKTDFGFSEARSERIARTEIISAGRSGQYHGDKQSGMVIGKEWMAAHQDRTRAGHREADAQKVAFDNPFYVANADGQLEPLLFPGDTSYGASASNIINCRCWYKRILEGEPFEET